MEPENLLLDCKKEILQKDEGHLSHWLSNLPVEYTPTPSLGGPVEQDGQGMSFSNLNYTPSLPSMSPQPCSTPSFDCQGQDMSWASVCQEYAVLMNSKGEMDGRKFNKLALALLKKCIVKARQSQEQAAHLFSIPTKEESLFSPAVPGCHNAKELFGDFRNLLLNAKELHSEELCSQLVAFVDKTLPPLLTVDERKEELQKKCIYFLSELSPQLSIKLSPIIRSTISRQFGADIEDMLAEVLLPEMSVRDKSNLYSKMLEKFLGDTTSISFAVTNRQLMGNLLPADLWFLTFFAFVTTRRCRGDNLLMLGLVGMYFYLMYTLILFLHNCVVGLANCTKIVYLFLGKSSVGKSLLFESVVLHTAHQLLSSSSSSSGDAGVGRFQTGSKNTVIFHDINIGTLLGAGNIFLPI